MTLKECYNILGDYDDMLKRLLRENIIKKYVLNFLDDERYNNLKNLLADKKYDEALHTAHAFKGICLTLGFEALSTSTSELFDILKKQDWDDKEISEVFQNVTNDYDMTIKVINEFRDSVDG